MGTTVPATAHVAMAPQGYLSHVRLQAAAERGLPRILVYVLCVCVRVCARACVFWHHACVCGVGVYTLRVRGALRLQLGRRLFASRPSATCGLRECGFRGRGHGYTMVSAMLGGRVTARAAIDGHGAVRRVRAPSGRSFMPAHQHVP